MILAEIEQRADWYIHVFTNSASETKPIVWDWGFTLAEAIFDIIVSYFRDVICKTGKRTYDSIL